MDASAVLSIESDSVDRCRFFDNNHPNDMKGVGRDQEDRACLIVRIDSVELIF
jgi:hypothetical protein